MLRASPRPQAAGMIIVCIFFMAWFRVRFNTGEARRGVILGGVGEYGKNKNMPSLPRHSKSSQVFTLPIAKSQTRIKTKTCTAAVCIAGRKAPPDFNTGRRMSRCPRSKNATRVPPSLCNVTQTSDPADPPHEHVECAARVCVARDLQNSSWQAKYGLILVAGASHEK
jgi:hypothetical protein